MMNLSIDLMDGNVVPALLYTVTRIDETVERVTNYTHDITIGANTWTAMGGLQAGVLTQRNDGTPPIMGLSITLTSAGKFRFRSVHRGLYERAHILVQLTDANNPLTADFIFEGLMLGAIQYNLAGQATFDLISKYAVPRDIFVHKFQLGCQWDFGDPVTCGVPVFTYITGGDMAEISRNSTVPLGARQQFPFGDGDYGNLWFQATVAGITAASAPSFAVSPGATVSDGGVTWLAHDAWARTVQIAATDGVRTLTFDRDPDPRATSDNAWYHPGKLLFTSGEYKGRVFSGGNWDGAARTWQVYLPCPFAAVNDSALIAPHCDRTYDRCLNMFNNTHNHGGYPFQLGAKAQAQQMALA